MAAEYVWLPLTRREAEALLGFLDTFSDNEPELSALWTRLNRNMEQAP